MVLAGIALSAVRGSADLGTDTGGLRAWGSFLFGCLMLAVPAISLLAASAVLRSGPALLTSAALLALLVWGLQRGRRRVWLPPYALFLSTLAVRPVLHLAYVATHSPLWRLASNVAAWPTYLLFTPSGLTRWLGSGIVAHLAFGATASWPAGDLVLPLGRLVWDGALLAGTLWLLGLTESWPLPASAGPIGEPVPTP
jgi:hypothetical protein